MKTHTDRNLSAVTAIMPQQYADPVIDALIEKPGTSALVWHARGTLLHDKWYRQILPRISPAKVMLQLLLPTAQLDAALATVIDRGKLDMQGAGAVFASPCQQFWAGSQFHDWPQDALSRGAAGMESSLPGLKSDLNVIYCVLERNQTLAVSRAAIDAGAHGPVVFYGDGYGLRDHLGWLRITKQADKEVLTVLVDDKSSTEVFTAMAAAAEIHLPGRGFMFMLPQQRGLFNLPSRASAHAYDANMQQIINAIDNLSGHTHWRDQSAYSGAAARSSSLRARRTQQHFRQDQRCVCAVVERDDVLRLSNMMLRAGATGMQISYAHFAANEEGCELAGAKINKEYAILRSVLSSEHAAVVSEQLRNEAEQGDMSDICMFLQDIPLVASYVPSGHDYREPALMAGMAESMNDSTVVAKESTR